MLCFIYQRGLQITLFQVRGSRFPSLAAFCLALVGVTGSQAQTTSVPAPVSAGNTAAWNYRFGPALESLTTQIRNERRFLDKSEQALIAQGATDAQLDAWEIQNTHQFHELALKADLFSAYGHFIPLEIAVEIAIPDDATAEMEDFLIAKATVRNGYAQIHNQLAQEAGSTITVKAALALQDKQEVLFQKPWSEATQQLAVKAKVVADQSAHDRWEIPPPAVIPPGMDSQRAALLSVRSQIARGEALIHNANCRGSRDELEAAMQQWKQQNANLYQQRTALAQALAKINANQETNENP